MKNLKSIILWTIFALIWSIDSYSQVIGNAFLSGQTDHSGIKVKFIPNSITAQLDSTFTIADGSYSLNLNGGLYQVLFANTGYQDLYYDNGNIFAIATTDTLNDVTLQPGSATYVSDTVSGNWTNNNVYIINGDIIIPYNSTLSIEAGTAVKFNGDYSIIANGTLFAIGAENSPIIITSNLSIPSEGDWNKIEINNSTSIIDNCIIEYCKFGFRFSDYGPTISNNEIRNFSEGGIYCLNCSPLISGNTIHNFNIQYYSYGIWVEGYASSSTIECNTIYNGLGYGIITKSDNDVRNNVIYSITGVSRGKGIWVNNQCNPLVENNHIYNCRIGIDIGNSVNSIPNPRIINNTINDNSYAGIYFNDYYANGTVINNIIVNNGYGIKQDVSFSTTPDEVSYNLVWNNTNGDFFDVQITGIGQIVTTNSNGDPIDSYFNLNQDPLFVNNTPPVISSNSPCINAGDTTYSANLGFDTSFTCEEIQVAIEDTNINNAYNSSVQNFPNPFTDITNITYSISEDSYVKIEIFDLYGKLNRQLQNEFRTKGEHKVNFSGKEMQSGLYLLKVTTSFYSNQKIIVKI